MTMYEYTSKDLKRFWSKVAITANLETCWEWQGRTSPYGHFRMGGRKGRNLLAHRVSWELAYGQCPDSLWVLHKCDNPKCVNPKHLFLGTHLTNMQDKASKGRQFKPSGERNGTHKLTQEQVEYIRERYAQGDIYQHEIAKEMGISRSQVGLIVRGGTWKHLLPLK